MSKTNFEFLDALGQIARDKGISVEALLDALANALVAAYKRTPTAAEEAVVTIDPESGEIRVYGQELDEDGNVTREWDDTPDDFGRIAAQTAKQVILQRIREVERDLKYEEYAGREGDIVTGIVQQTDNRYTLLDLGKVEALLPQAEQVSYERYEHGARLKAYIVEVRKTTKGPQIVVSRSHPGLIKRLFELEVPEISSGAVEIKAAAREPGHRTKIAVWSNDPNVDPVGACVGARGSRVRMVTNELRGERVDVVPYSDDPVELIQSALAPARVREVRLDDETGTATVIVSDYQLSLAIGKEGQNARLAARLTGWRIDIKSETQLAEEEAGYGGEEWAQGEWVQNDAGEMVWQPAEGGEALSATQWSEGAEGAEGTDGAEGAAGSVVAAPGESRETSEAAPGAGVEPPPAAEPAAGADALTGENPA
jgi:transcription termination/antitermination protein NusA